MIKNKKSMQETMILLAVVVVGGIILFTTIVHLSNQTAGGALTTLKKWAGFTSESDLEKEGEAERVTKELRGNAENVYSQFESVLKKCINEYMNDVSCICGTLDFTEINDYNLILSNDAGTSTLTLLDSNRVPVGDKKSNIGRLLILHSSSGLSNGNSFNDYSQRLVYVLFSKDRVYFKLTDTEFEKYKGAMTNIFFRKFTNNMLVVDNSRYGTRDCKTEEQPFGYIKR